MGNKHYKSITKQSFDFTSINNFDKKEDISHDSKIIKSSSSMNYERPNLLKLISCLNCNKNINILDCFILDYPNFCCGECYWSNWFRNRSIKYNKKLNESDNDFKTSNDSDNELDKKVTFVINIPPPRINSK